MLEINGVCGIGLRYAFQFYVLLFQFVDIFLQSCPVLDYSASMVLEIVRFDRSNSILIYKCPKNFFSLREYYLNYKAFPTKLPELIGITLASFHSETMEKQNYVSIFLKNLRHIFKKLE